VLTHQPSHHLNETKRWQCGAYQAKKGNHPVVCLSVSTRSSALERASQAECISFSTILQAHLCTPHVINRSYAVGPHQAMWASRLASPQLHQTCAKAASAHEASSLTLLAFHALSCPSASGTAYNHFRDQLFEHCAEAGMHPKRKIGRHRTDPHRLADIVYSAWNGPFVNAVLDSIIGHHASSTSFRKQGTDSLRNLISDLEQADSGVPRLSEQTYFLSVSHA